MMTEEWRPVIRDTLFRAGMRTGYILRHCLVGKAVVQMQGGTLWLRKGTVPPLWVALLHARLC